MVKGKAGHFPGVLHCCNWCLLHEILDDLALGFCVQTMSKVKHSAQEVTL